MQALKNRILTIDEYIAGFPQAVQEILNELRAVIKTTAPQAEEKISYQMPAFDFHGNLVYFAAYKKHIGFYPTSSGIEYFKEELAGFQISKGTIRFPLGKPLPLDLICHMVDFRVRENMEKLRIKKKL